MADMLILPVGGTVITAGALRGGEKGRGGRSPWGDGGAARWANQAACPGLLPRHAPCPQG